MRLHTRLFLSTLLLCGMVAGGISLVVQRAWRLAEQERFEEESQAAWASLERELGEQSELLASQLGPHCATNPLIDSALVGLLSGTLSDRLIGLQAGIPDLMRSMRFDGLLLITPKGDVLSGSWPEGPPSAARLRSLIHGSPYVDTPAPGFVASCRKTERGESVVVLGYRRLAPLLARFSERSNLQVALDTEAPRALPQALVQRRALDSIGGRTIVATRSASSLTSSLRHLDTEIATAFLLACLLSFAVAWIVSRTLSRPIRRFAERTFEAARGEAHAIDDESTPELSEAAAAFNRTLDALRDLRSQLAAAERIAARREVARRVAHEVKNPLSPIRTSIETLVKLKKQDPASFEEYFDETARVVLTEVGRLSRLVSHFAEYANLPSPNLGLVSLRELCSSVVQLYVSSAPHLRFEQSAISRSDAALADPVNVVADEAQVRQILTNLVKNAIEATQGDIDARVVIELQREGTRAIVSVRDNGPGVREPETLFEPYRSTKTSGSGLGLPISHRIATEHGGDLTYGTDPMGGARFDLNLPIDGPPRLNPTPSSGRS